MILLKNRFILEKNAKTAPTSASRTFDNVEEDTAAAASADAPKTKNLITLENTLGTDHQKTHT